MNALGFEPGERSKFPERERALRLHSIEMEVGSAELFSFIVKGCTAYWRCSM